MVDKKEESKKRPSFPEMWESYKRMLILAKPQWKMLVIASLFLIVGASMGLSFPLVIGNLVDTALIKNPISALVEKNTDTPPVAEPAVPEKKLDADELLQQKSDIKRAAVLLLIIFLVQGKQDYDGTEAPASVTDSFLLPAWSGDAYTRE